MGSKLGLGRLTILYTVGNLASKVISLVLFFVYTYFLDKASIGYFDLILTTLGWLTPILGLQLSEAVLRWTINADSSVDVKQVITACLMVMAVNLFLFLGIYIVLFQIYVFTYPFLIFLLVVFQTIYPLLLQLARGKGNNKVYVISGILYSLSYAILAVGTLVILKMDVEGLLLANIGAALISIFYLAHKLRFTELVDIKSFNSNIARSLISYSLPLIPNTLSWWAISAADRYIILYYLGTSYNGIFAVAMKFPTILLMFSNIFTMAWQEKAILTFESADRDKYYSEVFDKYFTLLFSAILVLTAVTKPALTFLVQESYYQIWQFLPILYLAVGFQSLSSFYGTGYISSKDTKGALTTTIYGTFVTVAANFILIPKLGLIGSSLSIFFGYFVMFLVRTFKTRKYFKISLNRRKIVFLTGLIVACGCVSISENTFILGLNCLISLALAAIINRRLLNEYQHKLASFRQARM